MSISSSLSMDSAGTRRSSTAVSTVTQSIRHAAEPFNRSTADIILRSSDLVDFRVHKCILSEASSIFSDMFMLAQPQVAAGSNGADGSRDATNEDASLPVITMQEDSGVLDNLLRICYPVPRKPLHIVGALSPVMAAAVKYAMDGILSILREDLRIVTPNFPLRAYCLATYHGFTAEAAQAAKSCLPISIPQLHTVNIPELKLIDGNALLTLIRYHQRCSQRVLALGQKLPFLSPDWVWFTCDERPTICPKATKSIILPKGETSVPALWWLQYVLSMFVVLRDTPYGDAIRRNTWLWDEAIRGAMTCPKCRKHALKHMRVFVQKLADEVDITVSKVKLSG
ncbi:hypothetical protein DAEQUDRAFT_808072 [Daedalea quercina L-15889]|uniref:BTB domain-containing protein n=1 Tax=Daedalea quercina L-15889 TaxID=1314783 RepID=A0A165TT21_9APHY|nr:hypothetical protein DAEQUDRAFT_808072 [Daedalea quercina L-15889]